MPAELMTKEQGAQLIDAITRLTSMLELRLGPPKPAPAMLPEFFSVDDIAARWRCSRGTVYNRLRSAGAIALDFSGKKQSRSKRSIPRATVLQIEEKFTRRVS